MMIVCDFLGSCGGGFLGGRGGEEAEQSLVFTSFKRMV